MRRLALIGTTAIAAGPFGGPNFGQLVSRKELVRISEQGFRRVRQTRNSSSDGKFGGTTTSHRSPSRHPHLTSDYGLETNQVRC